MRSKFKWIFTLLVAFMMQFSFAQEKTVTGVVSDDLGPIVGANVVVKGTTRGTTTDFDGKYAIAAKQGEVLVVSFVGMTTKEVTVGASNNYDVKLVVSSIELVGTEIFALGIKRKADAVVSSYQVVKSEEITQAAAPNAVQSLAGKVSGLTISSSSSVNPDARIVINGTRTISGNAEALVVIDNVISSSGVLQSLPPDVIESMNVIKGAQGAVLYGERGSNGVIIVTTKAGSKEAEKIQVSYNSAIDFQSVSYLPVRQTRYGQGWYGEQIAIENGSWGAEMNGQIVPVGLPQANGEVILAPYTGDEDNIKDFFKTSANLQNTVSITAGDLKSGYARLTLGRQDRDFVIDGDVYKRTNVLFRAGKKLGKFTVDGNVNYYSARTHRAASNQNSGTFSLYGQLLQAATNIPISQFDGVDNNSNWNVYYRSPYWTRDNIRTNNTADFFSGGINFIYELNDNISFVNNSSVQLTTSDTQTYVNAWTEAFDLYNSFSNRITRSSLTDSNSTGRYIYSDFLVNLDYDLTESINFKSNIGINLQETGGKTNSVGGQDLDVANIFYNYNNVLAPSLASELNNTRSLRRSFSYFANFDFGYKDYLFLNIAGRADYASVLDRTVDGIFYPGVGVSFIPTKAFSGLKGDILNYAKVTASLTGTGNSSAIGTYATDQVAVVANGFPYGDLASYSNNFSPTFQFIKPERNYTKEASVSLGFFNDRLTFDGQYFYTDTEDMITTATASSASGYNAIQTNIGKLHNSGFNIDLGATPIKGTDGSFEWTTRFNFSTNETIVDKVSDGTTEISVGGSTNDQVAVFAVEGEEFPTIKGIGYQRDEQGRVVVDANTGNPLYTSDFKIFGTSNSDYILGFTNKFSYKGITLTTVADYRHGGVFYSGGKYQLAWTGNLLESAENGRAGGFIFPNSVIQTGTDVNGNPVYTENTTVVTGGNSYQSYQTYFSNDYAFNNAENNILDKTAFKLREVALSYAFDSKLLKNTGINSLSLGLNARNLFIWLPKENKFYSDPESNFSNGNAQGISTIGLYPPTRNYGVSLNVTF